MRRIALLTVLASLSVSGAASAAEVQVDDFVVSAGLAQVTESNVEIEGGVVYRLVISGTINFTDHGITTNVDPVYCFLSSAGGCKPPSQDLSTSVGFAVGKKYPGVGGLESFAEFNDDGNKIPPYDESHVYELKFRPDMIGKGKLFVVTHPVKDAGENSGISGQFSVRLFREAPTQDVQFGVPSTFVAPAPGDSVQLTSPTLPSALKSLNAAVSLTGAAGRTFGFGRLRITDSNKLAAVCMYWGNIRIPKAQIQLPRRYATTDAHNAGIFSVCGATLLQRVSAAPPPTSSCRVTFVPVTVAGTKLTARERGVLIGFVKRIFDSACESSAAGRLWLALRGSTPQATMRALVGDQMSLGVVRARTTRPDGLAPTLGVRWSR